MIDKQWLIKNGPCKKYTAGQKIPFYSDDAPSERAMYFLLTGVVDAEIAGITAATIMPGEAFCGYEFFFGVGEFIYKAGVDSIVCVITDSTFDALAKAQPRLMMECLKCAYAGQVSSLHKSPSITKGPIPPPAANAGAAAKPSAPAATTTPAKPSAPVNPSAPSVPSGPTAPPMLITSGGIFPEGHKGYPGITKPEYKKLTFSKEYECLYCKKKFKDFKVFRSKLYQSKPLRFDLRRYYTDFQTEWFDIITCPHCYFSMFYTYYAEPKALLKPKIEKELLEAKKHVTLHFDTERDIDFVFASHYLALICAPAYIPTSRQLRARIWGNLSWLYEDVGDEDMMRFASEEAAKAYESVYSETKLTTTQEQTTCLTIAGMLYRAGKDNNLRKYLYTVKTVKGGDRTYIKMAEDMAEMLREEGK